MMREIIPNLILIKVVLNFIGEKISLEPGVPIVHYRFTEYVDVASRHPRRSINVDDTRTQIGRRRPNTAKSKPYISVGGSFRAEYASSYSSKQLS